MEEIVMRLIGPVEPTGYHDEDQKRLENLRTLTNLIEGLVCKVRVARRSATCHEESVRAIGKFADDFLLDLGSSITE